MKIEDIEEAAFWERLICLDCETVNEDDADMCGGCGGGNLLPAKTALRVVEAIERDEDA